jgi:MiaB/RimO family radical SAM methylthiotransferase
MLIAQIIITSCSRRSLEIEQIKAFLKGNGYKVSDDNWHVNPKSDLIIQSACGFTQAAEDFGFETLRRIQETKKPEAMVIFGGCIPKINPNRVSAEFGGPTFSPQSYNKLNDILNVQHKFEKFKRSNTYSSSLRSDVDMAIDMLKTFDGSFAGLKHLNYWFTYGMKRRKSLKKTYYIQIQEGCSMGCTYCVIHKAIGPLKSKSIETVFEEFNEGISKGYKQFLLMGDNAGSYGLDIGTNLGHLLDRISQINGNFKLDLSDIHPVFLSSIFKPIKKLCAQNRLSSLYSPIQSANNRILKLMHRSFDTDEIKQMYIDIKKNAPEGFRLGTSLIVGYPSETLNELNDTIRFCEDVNFDWVWCHSFSARPDTPAANSPDQLSPDEIHKRAQLVKSRLGGRSVVTTAVNSKGSRSCQG